MAQGSRQIQSQAQQQIQTLSPQQILVVKLLELPAVELEDRIHAELLENPALEEGKEDAATDEYADGVSPEEGMDNDANDYDSLSDYLTEDDIPDYKLQENNRSRDEQAEDIPFSDATSFYEILKEQLRERNLTEHQCELVEYLIGSLDDDGLLRKSLESICDELAIYAGIESTEEELEEALCILQDFDPAGIGARNLQECLMIQILRKKSEEKKPSPILNLEERIISDCYEEFTRKHWEKIIKKLDVREETFNEAIAEITKLNPRPGASLGETIGRNLQQIVPDFLVDTYDDGTINVSLNNRNVPELRMSRDFTEMVEEHTKNKANQSKESKEAMMFLKQKMDAAQGFIDAVKQRQNTLMTTMQAIIDLQRPFFLEGDESLLKPMILKDVAERTGLDISTISRVSNSKYVQTNFGIYPLKFFFSDGYTTEETFNEAIAEITKLNPRPGASLGETIGRNLQQIVPDFLVDTYDDGTINVSLNNRNVPELRMSRDFTEMVEEHTKNKANQSKESKEAMMFLKQKMDAAQGFIDAVKQRQNTLMTTMQAIIDLQRPFFLEGDESLLKPMILKDVAERTGLDISTISRVSNSKYVQTNFGIYPLKFFFSDGYTTEDGEEMSVREIRKILKECIDGEDKKKPLTDDELADILKEKGYPIARRTVAKYRQQLNIPVARLRK